MFSLLEKIISVAEENKFNIYLVGGFVRDLFLQKSFLKKADLDITVEGDGIKFAGILEKSLKGKVITYPQFLTATYISPSEERLDIATTRKETYPSGGKLPIVKKGSIFDDLYRRDFTINTLAIKLTPKKEKGKLIDLFNGIEDIKKGIIRVLHNKSFEDDPTRIFRAVRFEKRFNFRIESSTFIYLKKALKKEYPYLSGERIRNEIDLILKEKKRKEILYRLYTLKVLSKFVSKDVSFSSRDLNLIEKSLVKDTVLDKKIAYYSLLFKNLSIDKIKEKARFLNIPKKQTKRILILSRVKG